MHQHFSIRHAAIFCIVPLTSVASSAKVNDTYQQQHISQCGRNYLNNQTPQLLNNKNNEIYYLCFEGFAIGYSPLSKTALWSAEHLTKQIIEQANTLERVDNFHEESRLPNSIKAKLSDYQNVPYDRGHLAPNADMASLESQYDSFSLANIVPQNPKNNRHTWRNIEARTRYLALKYGEIYVITGVAFTDKNVKKLHNRVLVPSHLYKAIYIPSLQQAGVYYVPNDDSQRVEIISLNELALRTGMDSIPDAPSLAQDIAMPLTVDNLATQKTPTKDSDTKIDNSQILIMLTNLLLAILEWLASLLQE